MAGAHEIGDVALAEVGCQVWWRSDPLQDASTVRGGTVVAIEQELDQTTGEISRVFVTARARRVANKLCADLDRIPADRVGGVQGPDGASLRNAARALQGSNANGVRGPVDVREVDRCRWAMDLYDTIGGFR